MTVIFAFIMATVAYLMGVKELPCRISHVFAGGAAWEAGKPPRVILEATHENVLNYVPLSALKRYALDLQ